MIIHGVLQFLFAADVSLRCLDGSVAKQKSNLFELAAAIMAESGTGASVMPHAALVTMPNPLAAARGRAHLRVIDSA